MIKLIVADLDGTLAELREVHFNALNLALATIDSKYVISKDEHIKTFDGLSTNQKLVILNKHRGFPLDRMKEVNDLKQKLTIPAIEQFLKKDDELILAIKELSEKYTLMVASNSIRATIDKALDILGIKEYVTAIFSNEDVGYPKPHPSIFLKAIYAAGVTPEETLILEDSPLGREAAFASGAYVYDVDTPSEVIADKICKYISNIKPKKKKWHAKNTLNILVPMSGRGSRFASQGYKLPKPLIDVKGQPMIKWVIDSLKVDANFIFVVDQNHIDQFRIDYLLKSFAPGCTIVVDNPNLTGPCTSALSARKMIDNDKHLFIVNCDQYLEYDSTEFFYGNIVKGAAGAIITFKENEKSPKWSYARLEAGTDSIIEVKEKQVISDLATTGHYYYDKGSDFVKYADQMIAADFRINNEFYVAPTYEYMIADGKRIKNFTIDKFYGLGVPADLDDFLKLDYEL